ncbi:histone deacetylase 8-like [Branchiostoma floridae x Branchiostoma japonicum]
MADGSDKENDGMSCHRNLTPNRDVLAPRSDVVCRNDKVVFVHSQMYVDLCNNLAKVPGRASAVHGLIEAYGLTKELRLVEPRPATVAELTSFHSTDYIDHLRKASAEEDEEKDIDVLEEFGLCYDCPILPGVYEYAAMVAGATLTAAQCLVDGECQVAINWHGGWHHAKKDEASGFCYVNDPVLAILRLRERFSKVLYIDLDLHHGDGVEDAFCCTSRVMTLSLHKFDTGFFPGTGDIQDTGMGRGRYYTVNVPLRDGIQDSQYFSVFNKVVSQAESSYRPEAVVLQLGADGMSGDPMGCFNLTPQGLGRCLELVLDWKLPTLLLGGGGYHVGNTARCWTSLTAQVLGKSLPPDIPEHEHFTEYGPDYELGISPGNRVNHNSDEYIEEVINTVSENLAHVM